jgi:HEAT repeat protein
VPAKELAAAILQRNDADLRDKALARLQAMLAAEAPDGGKTQALATLGSVLSVKFDRKPFWEAVVPLLQSKDPDIRALAVRCLPGLDAGIGDLGLVLPLAVDASPRVRMEVGAALISIGQGKEPEKVIPALTTLLRDPERSIVERTIRSMWGQYSSPEFDQLLIQLAENRDYHHWVIYHALSTMRSKSPAVCRRLVEELSDPDWNNSGRAAWGLTYGVTDEAKSLVEEGLLKALPQETNDYTRENELRALRLVATDKSRPYLKSVVDSSLETDKFKQLARDVLAGLERKP